MSEHKHSWHWSINEMRSSWWHKCFSYCVVSCRLIRVCLELWAWAVFYTKVQCVCLLSVETLWAPGTVLSMCLQSSAGRPHKVDEGYFKVTSSKQFTGLGISCPSLVFSFSLWEYGSMKYGKAPATLSEVITWIIMLLLLPLYQAITFKSV